MAVDASDFNRALNEAARAARELAAQHSAMATDLAKRSNSAADALDDLGDKAANATTQQKKLNDLQKKSMKLLEEEAKLQTELNELTAKANKLQAEGNQESDEYIGLQKQINAIQAKAQKTAEESRNTLQQLNTSQKGLGKTSKVANAALEYFGLTILNSVDVLKEQYKATGGVVEGSGNLFADLLSRQIQALSLGMAGPEFEKTIASQRQTINAMGGTTKALEELDPAISRYRILTGDNAEALKLATQSAKDLASKGIRPTAAAIDAYTDDVVQLTKYTGLSADQARDFYAGIADDEDSIHMLRTAREGERDAILQSQRALIQQSLAAGMSAEQAKNAAKMLNKMVAAKPLDRLKQAAKIRAMGAAMGVAGSEEAAQAVIAGPRATAEQKQQLQQFGQSVTNAVDSMAGKGLGSEIFASALTEKLGLEEQFGKGSPFSTTLGDSLKPTQDALNKLTDASTTLQGAMLGQLTLIWGTISTLLGGAVLPITIGAGLIGAAPKVAAIFKNVMGGFGGAGGSDVGPDGKDKGKGKGRLAHLGGKAIGFGGRLLAGAGVGAAAGLAGDYIGDKLEESGHEKMGAGAKIAGSAATGAALGSVIPGVGTLIGGGLGAAYGLYQNWGKMTGPSQAAGPAQQLAGAVPMMRPSAGTAKDTTPASEADTSVLTALTTTSDGITKQIEQMNTSNTLLQQLADVSSKHMELAEKQLIALTLTEKEKSDITNRSNLRKDSKFGAQYGYV